MVDQVSTGTIAAGSVYEVVTDVVPKMIYIGVMLMGTMPRKLTIIALMAVPAMKTLIVV